MAVRNINHPEYSPRLTWQQWTRQSLGKELSVTDVDGVFFKFDGRILIVELKCYGQVWTQSQSFAYQIIHQSLKDKDGELVEIKVGDYYKEVRVKYLGCYLISFNGAEGDFSKGVKVNGKPMTEEEVIKILSLTGYQK